MFTINERFITDKSGKRIGVLLDIEDYKRLLKLLSKLESFRLNDRADGLANEEIPFEEALERSILTQMAALDTFTIIPPVKKFKKRVKIKRIRKASPTAFNSEEV